MNKKLIKRILAVAVIATFLIGTFSYAKEEEKIQTAEQELIMAEDIGIKTVNHIYDTMPIVEETEADEDVVVETKDKAVDVPVRMAKETVEEEPVVEETVEETEIPEGMYEGCNEGVYLPINNYDCEIHDGCHKCKECVFISEYGYDEEINPDGGWYRAKFCEICGHGGCEPITEAEVEREE